jgi:hypothetical protein
MSNKPTIPTNPGEISTQNQIAQLRQSISDINAKHAAKKKAIAEKRENAKKKLDKE